MTESDIESFFNLGLIASHLQTQLTWATQHHLPAGSHAPSAPTPMLVLWLVTEGAVRVTFSDAANGEREEITLRAGDAALMGTGRHRSTSVLQEVVWLSVGFTLRLFPQDYTRQLFPPVFQWRPDETENRNLRTVLELARANCRIVEATRPARFPMRCPSDPLQK
jgi:hypothetical protein